MSELKFDIDGVVWLCPFCGANANPGQGRDDPGVCSRCSAQPTLRQMFGDEEDDCGHPRSARSRRTGECMRCRRERRRA